MSSFLGLMRHSMVGVAPACIRGRAGVAVTAVRRYHNRNPEAFAGTPQQEPCKIQAATRVFKHYGILFGKTNARMTAQLYYYHTEYKGPQHPKVLEPRVLCEASSAEPHFIKTLYSTHNRSAAYHMGRLIAKRAYECGVLPQTTLLKYALGRPLGVQTMQEMLRTLSMTKSSRMKAFAKGYKEERELLIQHAENVGAKFTIDSDGDEYWPQINGEEAGVGGDTIDSSQ